MPTLDAMTSVMGSGYPLPAVAPPVEPDVLLNNTQGEVGITSQLNLSLGLGNVLDVEQCEFELQQRVGLHEAHLRAEARSEVERAVFRHETWLGS